MNEPPNYPTYAERTFNLYRIKANPGVDYLRHPSGVIVVQLGADHECFGKIVKEVSFDMSTKKNGGKDLTKQTVSGKGKKGGLKMERETRLCIIRCEDGSSYTIRSGIRATLIEANARLVTEPQLLKESREYAGFLAIVIPPAVLNNQRNTIPPEFDTIVRVGREVLHAMKLFAPSESTSNRRNQVEDTEIEAKRPKIEDAV